MADVFVKDEKTGDRPYFIYLRDDQGWTNATGLRFGSKSRAESLARTMQEALDEAFPKCECPRSQRAECARRFENCLRRVP